MKKLVLALLVTLLNVNADAAPLDFSKLPLCQSYTDTTSQNVKDQVLFTDKTARLLKITNAWIETLKSGGWDCGELNKKDLEVGNGDVMCNVLKKGAVFKSYIMVQFGFSTDGHLLLINLSNFSNRCGEQIPFSEELQPVPFGKALQ